MQISESIRAIAKERNLPLVDLFQALHRGTNNLTDDGLQITTMGHAVVANAFARDLGLPSAPLTDAGEFADPNLADLRAAIIAKNRLWFDYWRPQNWAFLGGDRTEQPSSRDHRDPAVRWFPAEIERYPALIANKEATILRLAKEASKQDHP
jgi:hypothetical protein